MRQINNLANLRNDVATSAVQDGFVAGEMVVCAWIVERLSLMNGKVHNHALALLFYCRTRILRRALRVTKQKKSSYQICLGWIYDRPSRIDSGHHIRRSSVINNRRVPLRTYCVRVSVARDI